MADPPDDSFGCFARMDWVSTGAVIDPDHHKPPAQRGPANHLARLPISNLGLCSIHVMKHLFDLFYRDPTFGMIGTEMPAIGSIPDDRPIVHPFSIYKTDGQIGVGCRPSVALRRTYFGTSATPPTPNCSLWHFAFRVLLTDFTARRGPSRRHELLIAN